MIGIDERGLAIIAAARGRIGELTQEGVLDGSIGSLSRFLQTSPSDQNKVMAAVFIGDQLMGDSPERFLRVEFAGDQINEIQIVTEDGAAANLLSWVEASLRDPQDDNLEFKLKASNRILGRLGGCLQCGHRFSREERTEMEEFTLRSGRTGYRRACPDCGAAFILLGNKFAAS